MEAVDLFMLALLPALLVLSGFFSGSETALFSMTETERIHLRRQGSLAARAIESLLSNQRMLLITVLLGNMVVNVLYFVLSSVLMMRLETGLLGGVLIAVGSLLGIVLLGEVLPKMLANAQRTMFASFAAPVLLTLHNIITPLRIALDKLVVTPLSRLTAPRRTPPQLDEEELTALLEISSQQGVIDVDEQRILRDVFALGRLRVRDVMTPRVRMQAVRITATREEVIELVRETHLTRLPVYANDLDHIVGVLHVKEYLLDARGRNLPIRRAMNRPRFVPLVARLDQLLDHLRSTKSKFAVVVDEFGGTAGVVALEDVVERLVGDIAAGEEIELTPTRLIAPNTWQVDGDMSVHDWAEAFGQQLVSPRVATLGGLIVDHLGRAPEVGDVVTLGNLRLEVMEVDKARVTFAKLTLTNARYAPREAKP